MMYPPTFSPPIAPLSTNSFLPTTYSTPLLPALQPVQPVLPNYLNQQGSNPWHCLVKLCGTATGNAQNRPIAVTQLGGGYFTFFPVYFSPPVSFHSMHDHTNNFIPKFQLILSPISCVGSNSHLLPSPDHSGPEPLQLLRQDHLQSTLYVCPHHSLDSHMKRVCRPPGIDQRVTSSLPRSLPSPNRFNYYDKSTSSPLSMSVLTLLILARNGPLDHPESTISYRCWLGGRLFCFLVCFLTSVMFYSIEDPTANFFQYFSSL